MFSINIVAPSGRDFNRLNSLVRGYLDKTLHEVYFPEFERIAQEGADVIRYVIATSSTPTGLAEGREGRIKTGAMIDSVGSKVNIGKTSMSAVAGFINNRPDYTIYQENGTRRIQAMDAIIIAREYMISALGKLK